MRIPATCHEIKDGTVQKTRGWMIKVVTEMVSTKTKILFEKYDGFLKVVNVEQIQLDRGGYTDEVEHESGR